MPTESTRPDIITAAFTGNVVLENQDFAGTAGISDVLKFSAASAFIRGACSATGGVENACDSNNRSIVTIEGQLKLAGGEQAGLVIKGGSSFCTAPAGRIVFEPDPKSRTDMLVDDWSDQAPDASHVVVAASRTDGEPVRVVFGRFCRPVVIGLSRVVWSWTIGLHVYNVVKGLIRAALRIPAGTKGPSWF